ncbi:M15 family metallopeptidase [Lactococcus muris]|uniref:M15 family metallopeptidase n=1 Tax=Lactococcus muris TaxID=2941330 RepID=A0ABV4DAC5_9LACT
MMRKNKSRKRKDHVILLVLVSAIAVVFGLRSYFSQVQTTVLPVLAGEQQEAEVQEEATMITISLSDIVDTKNLQLVNSEYAFASNGSVPDLVSSNNGLFLRTDVLTAVSSLLNDTRNAVGGQLILNSGYRTAEEQEQLYFNTADKAYVQEAGHSEHETGLAADIAIQNVADVENSPQSQYLIKNAWKYGFILRYPGDKTAITGIANEPWHFRYVGEVHAQYMTEYELVLEEYIERLKKVGSYRLNKGGKNYTVRYETPHDNQLQLPNDVQYEISSDNTGGYIITSWK